VTLCHRRGSEYCVVEHRLSEPEHVVPCDVELVAQLTAGDQQALGLLYDRYATRAYSLAQRICCEAGLADEAVQNAFLLVWQAPSRYDPRAGSFATWLMAVVHHKSVDLVRREQVRSRAALACADEKEWLPPQGADVAVLATERAERVQAALRQLPVEQRRALTLAYFGGYTQREINELTAVPLGTVKSRVFTALERLRIMLAPHADELQTD
jgi:RNA polymerase sigma factor (sigma-70 family)